MDAEHVERVVVAEALFQRGAGEIADRPGGHADQRAVPRQHEARGRSDRAEAGDRAGNQPEHRRLAALRPFQAAPDDRAGAGGEMGGDDGEHGARAGAERRAAVEAEPADPQQAGADHCLRQIERREISRP